jgi:hypothetical protein
MMKIEERAEKIIQTVLEMTDANNKAYTQQLWQSGPTAADASIPARQATRRDAITAEMNAAISEERGRIVGIIENKMHSSPKRRDIIVAINEEAK